MESLPNNNSLRIVQLIQKSQTRGAEMFTCQLANHLIRIGHQVKVIAIFDEAGELPFLGEIISLHASSKNRFFDRSAWKRLAGIIKEFNPDVVQANAGDTLKYAIFSKLAFRWKTPIISRNASEVGQYLKSSLQKRMNTFFYKKVDYVISVSAALEKDLLVHFPSLYGKTETIPVGLELKTKIDEIHLEPKEKKHIIHVGGFSFEKDHRGLLRIFKEILKKNDYVQLHLVGNGPLKSEIEKQAQFLNLEDRVIFYGFVNNPLSYIKSADVLVLPSIIEGLPGVLLEAMYCKTPVIAYNVGGISEIVNTETGKLIEKGDENAFAEAIIKTLEQPDEQQIENAHKMVIKDYMNVQIALRFEKAYEKVIG